MDRVLNELKSAISRMPIVDAHNHVVHPGIARHIPGYPAGKPQSRLAALILDLSNEVAFRAAGMPEAWIRRIMNGELGKDESREAILKYTGFVETTTPYIGMIRGLQELYGIEIPAIDAANWDRIEEAADERYEDLTGWYRTVFDRQRIRTALLNMWTAWGASYYGAYQNAMTQREVQVDKRCFTRIATFDSHALHPFQTVTGCYAELVDCSIDTLAQYEDFLAKLACFLITERDVKGLKISEQYFRRLDYRPVPRATAERLYKKNLTRAEWLTLSNYITCRIFELAAHYRVPVQVHTGELWGEIGVSELHPDALTRSIKDHKDVSFDLLHGGFPYLGESSIMGANAANVFINISWLPLVSYDLTVDWLGRFLDIIPANKISVGSDVFNLEAMCGTLLMIRDIIAEALARKVRSGIMRMEKAVQVAEMLLYRNAEALYRL